MVEIECTHPRSASAKKCRSCHLKEKWADPHFRARHAERNRQTLALKRQDPEWVARQNERLAAGRRKAVETGAIHNPEASAKAGRTYSARMLGWCPPHLRAEYRRLVIRGHFKAAEAREIILNQYDAELKRKTGR